MGNNKIFIKLYVPKMDLQYDIFLPLNKQIYDIILLLVKAINEFSGGYYNPKDIPMLYDRLTAKPFDVNLTVIESTIRNGTELILI